ncbi:MAG: cytochrome c family protein [candidate division KSB1 bacterium]|nr:cytochrome c family protein [candidate division KSB1 bacterium]
MRLTNVLLAALPLLFFAACSEPQEAPTGPQAKVSVHEPGWNDLASPNFHGKVLAANQYDASECRQCHGSNFDGGISEVSCRTCHASYPHAVSFAGEHPTYIKTINYDLDSCQPCHGEDYSIKKLDKSCLTCHTQANGPEACNTCHGNFSGNAADLKNSAPPKGLNDETDATAPAVGAHQPHLPFNPALSVADACRECHVVPPRFDDPRHINNGQNADVVFTGPLGSLKTEGGNRAPNPSYSTNNNTCSGTYCHGNWGLLKAQSFYDFVYVAEKMEGSFATPTWVDPNSAACETCHGLPPTGHNFFPRSACMTCHGDVVDEFGQLKNRAKHANGKVNVFEMEYPMF